MKIPGAILARPVQTPPAEQPREHVGEVLPRVSRDRFEPLAPRPVTQADAAEVIYLHDRYPAPLARSAQARQAQLAVAAYESVRRLEQRDDLRSITGIDVFA